MTNGLTLDSLGDILKFSLTLSFVFFKSPCLNRRNLHALSTQLIPEEGNTQR